MPIATLLPRLLRIPPTTQSAALLTLLAALLTLLAAPLAPRAAAAGPEPEAAAHPLWGPALARQDEALARAGHALLAAEGAVTRADQGLRGRLDLLPTAARAGRSGVEARASTALVLTARVDWIDDPAARANARLALHRAHAGVVEAVHREVRATTSAYLELRRAQVAVAVAEAAVASRRATFERAEASVLAAAALAEAGEPSPAAAAGELELALARLELERVGSAVQRALLDLSEARRAAERRGIDTSAAADAHRSVLQPDPLEGWRLAPPAAETSLLVVERRALELELALARRSRRGTSSLLDDLRLEASWTGTDARLRLSLGLDEGRPSGFVEASLREAARDAWSVGVSARVRLADSWARELAAAEQAVLEAERELLSALDDAPWLWADLRRAFAEAEEDLAFAERALELGREALRALDLERLGVAAAARRGEPGAEERLLRFDEAYARSELGQLRERDAFFRVWERYLRAAERASTAVGAPFDAPIRLELPRIGR